MEKIFINIKYLNIQKTGGKIEKKKIKVIPKFNCENLVLNVGKKRR